MTLEDANTLFSNVATFVGTMGQVRLVQWPDRTVIIATFKRLVDEPLSVEHYYKEIRSRVGKEAAVSFKGDPDNVGRMTVKIVATMRE